VLQEGEKLLIQQVSVYVPLQHLMYGQVGARGHTVSFPQDVSSVCKTLPRLPDNVQVVQVIKNFGLNDGTISSKTFSIRRPVVMAALHWLKKFNKQYNEIDVCEANSVQMEELQVMMFGSLTAQDDKLMYKALTTIKLLIFPLLQLEPS
jgi:hypothetical protein